MSESLTGAWDVHGPPGTGENDPGATVGEYTWADFLEELGHGDEVGELFRSVEREQAENRSSGSGLFSRIGGAQRAEPRLTPSGEDWDTISFDPTPFLGCHPGAFEDRLREAFRLGADLQDYLTDWLKHTPVTKDAYTWEHFKLEYYYDERGLRPRDEFGRVVPFDPVPYLGFHPIVTEHVLADAIGRGTELREVEDERTVNVDPELDEDAFFSTVDGYTTVVNRYDLEQAVPMERKPHLREVERYWVEKPNAFVIILHSTKENEKKFYLVGPHLNPTEARLKEYFTGKLRTTIKYSDDVVIGATAEERAEIIQHEFNQLLGRYGLFPSPVEAERGIFHQVERVLGREQEDEEGWGPSLEGELDGIEARPMPAILAEDPDLLTEYQVAKLEYLLTRDFVGFGPIDGIKHDVSVEDISCDGYDSPVFVYHSEYEQLITNVSHGKDDLDRFVVKLAQRSGKSISKRHPQVDATLPDGSRAQLTLGYEVSDHGTNYTIRQFNDVPFTPVDLINWHTFSLEELVFLWLAIENGKSVLFAGGTASGKTTSLNAVSLFIPSSSKIVSIEDTREVELPQRNWIASITRPAFSQDDAGHIDEFDLLEAALRQRPEYILMGEVRGEEGRTLFQVMSTGHTTLTTFHADTVGEVLKRFTTAPINVSKTMFTALDLVSVQTQTRVGGQKIRRNKVITEINRYDSERDEINVRDIHRWHPESDEFTVATGSNILEEVKFDRGWTEEDLQAQLFNRRVVLAYLVSNGLNEYAQVAATIQAFINDPDTVLTLIARDQLAASLEDLRGMESVIIDIAPEKEELVPRPNPDARTRKMAESLLEEAEERIFDTYRKLTPSPLVEALPPVERAQPITPEPGEGHRLAVAAAAAEGTRGATAGEQRAGSGQPSDATSHANEEQANENAYTADGVGVAGVESRDGTPNDR